MTRDGHAARWGLLPVLLAWTLACATGGGQSFTPRVKPLPQDTADAWYALGEGDSLESAKAAALADLAGRIATQVFARTDVTQLSELRGDRATFVERMRSQISTEVEDTKLSHYRLQETWTSGARTYALLALSIRNMASAKQTDLRDQDTRVRQLVERRSGQSRLKRLLDEPELSAALEAAEASVLVLRGLRPDFESDHMDRYLQIREEAKRDRLALRTVVVTDPISKTFSQLLSNQLNEKGFNPRVGKARSGEAVIRVTGRVSRHESFGAKEARLTVMLTTLDERGAELASVERSGVGTSMSSFEMAVDLAAKALARESARANPLEYLGLVHGEGIR